MKGLLIALVMVGSMVGAQNVSGQTWQERGWVDVNFGIATSAEGQVTSTFISAPDRGGERQTYNTLYAAPPRGASFDFGGGVMFTNVLGAGVTFTGTAHESTSQVDIRIPHPIYNNAFATDRDAGPGVSRTEGGVNLSLVARLPIQNDRLRVRVFGGPTYFRLKTDAISDIRYLQNYGLFSLVNIVDIAAVDLVEVEATAWGFHAGGDVSYFFTRNVGIGGFVRVSRGSADIDDTRVVGDAPVGVTLGGAQAGGGLRLRF
jgi:hypothetical protein